MAWNPRNWQIHPISFIDPEKKFEILAESDNNPQVIKLGDFFFGCLFCVSRKYPPTLNILENFLDYICDYVQKTGYFSKKIRVIYF